MTAFRDRTAQRLGLDLIVHINRQGLEQGANPFTHANGDYTDVMKTQALRQALDQGAYDAAIGGARRDEEKSRAKERIFSFRSEAHHWDARNQRPELWRLYNARIHPRQSMRIFPLSNWTELDVWRTSGGRHRGRSLYLARAARGGARRRALMVDDDRSPSREKPAMREVRFRTLGCYPLTGAIPSRATSVADIVAELRGARTSERRGRLIDRGEACAMEKKKQDGYF